MKKENPRGSLHSAVSAVSSYYNVHLAQHPKVYKILKFNEMKKENLIENLLYAVSAIVILIIASLIFVNSFYKNSEGEVSVIFNSFSGKIRVIGGHQSYHWKDPIIESRAVVTTGVMNLVYFNDIHAVTKDNFDILFSVVAMYRVPNKADSILNLFKKFGSEFDNSEKVHVLARDVLKKVISKYSIYGIDVEKRSKIDHELETEISNKFKEHGLLFFNVQRVGNVRTFKSLQ
jgi:uncharacterized membrane protein YqiK